MSLSRLGGGRNSQVYKISCSESEHYVVKHYYRHESDSRDRRYVEFSAMRFLWDRRVHVVPRPIASDQKHSVGIFAFVEGEQIPKSTITKAEVDQAVDFLMILKGLAGNAHSHHFSRASEACFSPRQIVQSIEARLRRFDLANRDSGQERRCGEFLRTELIPTFGKIAAWCVSELASVGMNPDTCLAQEHRTLSPSDFGFHNAIRAGDGQVIFLDFEYFGWDDPAKMIVDFLLHPAMELPLDLKRHFFRSLMERFNDDPCLHNRVRVALPLFGIKWCLILLNEFLPPDFNRRQFASARVVDREVLLEEQLAKAYKMLEKVTNHDENFACLSL